MSTLVDRGAQNERTRLAWQRTSLSMVLCALVLARLVATEQVLGGVALALSALVLGGALLHATRRRYTAAEASLRRGGTLPDARVPVLMVLLLTLVGLAAAGLLLSWG